MRVRRPRSITITQLMVVTAIGVLGGAYIWQPLILKYRKESPLDQSVVISKQIDSGENSSTVAK